MMRNQSVRQFRLYRIFNLVHNLVHTRLNFAGCNRLKSQAFYLWPNVSITFCHAYCCARRPPQNMSDNRNRSAVFQQFRGSCMPQVMKAQAGQASLVAGASPSCAPVSDGTFRVNSSVLAGREDEMMWLRIWETCPPYIKCRPRRLSQWNRAALTCRSL